MSEWRKGRVHVRQLPPDEQGVLRISIGGGPTPVPLDYCVFRGDHGQCVDLLRRALAALESKPIRCPYGKVGDMELDIDSDGRTDRHRK